MRPSATIDTGIVSGFQRQGVEIYLGIPYGASTAGRGRFAPPKPAAAWSGVRSSLFYGPMVPQSLSTTGMIGVDNDEDNHLLYRGSNGVIQSEDSLRANVWTPGTTGSRPVMVYLHGGAFVGGSGNDLLAYDGTNLAANHDVVVVTVNHRLNSFGFLDLASLELPGYENYVNVGMQDLVLLLQWVHTNAAAFGGDPSNVTIFGQSGGGIKVATLMSMPAAHGLFHRAIIQSGSMTDMNGRDESHAMTLDFLRELGVDPSNPAAAQDVPLDRVIAVTHDFPGVWAPTIDGVILSEPLLGAPDAPIDAISASVPVIVGTDLAEFVNGVDNPAADSFTEEDLVRSTRAAFGASADAIVQSIRATYPGESVFGVHAIAATWWMRRLAVEQTRAKGRQGGDGYSYVFGWNAPVVADRVATYHACEIAYVFDNAELCVNQTGGGPVPRQIGAEMSGAWAAFARTGDPNHAGLPHWSTWTDEDSVTMLFDSPTRAVAGLDAEVLRATRDVPIPGLHGQVALERATAE